MRRTRFGKFTPAPEVGKRKVYEATIAKSSRPSKDKKRRPFFAKYRGRAAQANIPHLSADNNRKDQPKSLKIFSEAGRKLLDSAPLTRLIFAKVISVRIGKTY